MLMDVTDAAKKLSVSESTIRRLIDSGKLQAMKVGFQLRISDSEIERYLKVEGRKMEAVIHGKRYKTEGATLLGTLEINENEDGEIMWLGQPDDRWDTFREDVEALGWGCHDLYRTANGNFFFVMDQRLSAIRTRDTNERIRAVSERVLGRLLYELIQDGWGKTYIPFEEAFPGVKIEDA